MNKYSCTSCPSNCIVFVDQDEGPVPECCVYTGEAVKWKESKSNVSKSNVSATITIKVEDKIVVETEISISDILNLSKDSNE